jgi:hypothetical protein
MNLIKSPKFGVAVIGVVAAIIVHFFPDIDETALMSVLETIFGALIVGTAGVEVVKEYRK